MNERPDEALELHMPYLSQVTGQHFSATDGKIIYSKLDPFITFEAQREWFHNPNNLCFYRNVNGSILNSFVAQKIYKKPPPKIEDVVWCKDLYEEMESLKSAAARNLAQLKQENLKKVSGAAELWQRAKYLYDNYDYLDAKRLSDSLGVQLRLADIK